MTDLEMTKLCAEAMGISIAPWPNGGFRIVGQHRLYNPLHDDAQAMALVKRFKLQTLPNRAHSGWWVAGGLPKDAIGNPELNRAIVECVARMSGGTHSGGGR
jgi:hypothetical protein